MVDLVKRESIGDGGEEDIGKGKGIGTTLAVALMVPSQQQWCNPHDCFGEESLFPIFIKH